MCAPGVRRGRGHEASQTAGPAPIDTRQREPSAGLREPDRATNPKLIYYYCCRLRLLLLSADCCLPAAGLPFAACTCYILTCCCRLLLLPAAAACRCHLPGSACLLLPDAACLTASVCPQPAHCCLPQLPTAAGCNCCLLHATCILLPAAACWLLPAAAACCRCLPATPCCRGQNTQKSLPKHVCFSDES